jgi:ElaB/YqjD/DUF883 family membrane-anchored ribosome-binding protein
MARARDQENGFGEVAEAWRHSAQKISADLARTIRDAREAAEQLSDAVRHSAEGVSETAMLTTRQSADAVQTSVRRHPIAWLAGAAGVGALIGLVLASSRR